MQDYSEISHVRVTTSANEANDLLDDFHALLDVFHDTEGILFFVLGEIRNANFEDILP